MSEELVFPVTDEVAARALINNEKYLEMYNESVKEPELFWNKHGNRIDWIKPYTKIKDVDFKGKVQIKWYYDGTLNASYNCLDRHLKPEAIKPPLYGREMTHQSQKPLLILSCIERCANSQMP